MQQYKGVQRQREFLAPRYYTPAAAQIRLRNRLYWNPAIILTSPEARQLDSYTGAQAGRYPVVVQGLLTTGLASSRSFVIKVNPKL